ncbi:MAG: NitT/TauT family transport system substrate-binding protein [Frankiales bacterium]|nr:NitT/TauT family transport system substrate-binding protein [Frankiales bacterium]
MGNFKNAVRLAAVGALALTAACGGSSSTKAASTTSAASSLRLGYFANVTHAGPVYGVASGIYKDKLGSTKLETQVFNAGPAAVEALLGGAIDAAYLGPGPAVNAFIKTQGDVVLVAGATSGGASLVVKPGITDLKGKKIADPQTGGTQDIALRSYLAGKGFKEDAQGAGDVTIIAQENSQTLDLFKDGKIDGAWVPEPWASRLVLEGGGTVLQDEKGLWPDGKFITTNLLVKKDFLKAHPQTIKALIEAQVESDKQIVADPTKAQTVVNAALKQLTGKSLKPAVIARAFAQITVTEDPLASTLKVAADHAFATGLVKKGDLKGIYDLTILDQVLGKTVDDAGLGKD